MKIRFNKTITTKKELTRAIAVNIATLALAISIIEPLELHGIVYFAFGVIAGAVQIKPTESKG